MSRPSKSLDAGTQPYRPLTAEDKAAIVQAIEQHYTLSAATRAALGDMSRYPAVVAAAKSDAAFGLSIEQSREVHRDAIRATIANLALGHERELTYQGTRTGDVVTEYDIEALRMLSRSRLPEHLDKKTEQTIHGTITVDDAAVNSRWVIGLDDLAHLDETEKRQLAAIIKKVQAGRNALSVTEGGFNAITDETHGGVIEAKFEELPAPDPASLRRH